MNQPRMNPDKHGLFLKVGRVTPCAPFGGNMCFGGQGTPMNREQAVRPTYPCPFVFIRG